MINLHNTAKQLRAAVIPHGNNAHIERYLLHLVQIRPMPSTEHERMMYSEIERMYDEVVRINR